MKFYIERASSLSSECPCKKAKYDSECNRWEIEINNFDELIELVKEEGSIVLDKDKITIYDDYIE